MFLMIKFINLKYLIVKITNSLFFRLRTIIHSMCVRTYIIYLILYLLLNRKRNIVYCFVIVRENVYNYILINKFANEFTNCLCGMCRTNAQPQHLLNSIKAFTPIPRGPTASSMRPYTYRPTLARYSRDTWQIVDVIVGVDGISLSAGMKLMARERYGCAERRRNFAIALCDGNPSKHVSVLPAYPRHHIPAVSSHLYEL